MRKHSAWQKDRNRVRRLNREVKAIVRRDDARAEWFNNRFAEMQQKARGLGFMDIWYIDSQYPASDWPPLDDMFIEVSGDNRLSITETGGVPAGLYVVRGTSSVWNHGKYDVLLRVTDVNKGTEDCMWFPRRGHRVVSCGEVGETPWLD